MTKNRQIIKTEEVFYGANIGNYFSKIVGKTSLEKGFEGLKFESRAKRLTGRVFNEDAPSLIGINTNVGERGVKSKVLYSIGEGEQNRGEITQRNSKVIKACVYYGIASDLYRIGANENVRYCLNLGLGLPIDTYLNKEKRIKYAEMFVLEEEVILEHRGKVYHITIKNVEVFAEGQAYLRYEMEKYENEDVILIDIGSGTTDYCTQNKGRIALGGCGSIPWGSLDLFDETIEAMKADQQSRGFKDVPTDYKFVEELFNGEEKFISGVSVKKEDYEYVLEEFFDDLVQQLVGKLKSDLEAKKLIFFGGTVHLIKDMIEDRFDNFEIIENPTFVNAEYFLRNLFLNIAQ